MKKILMSLSLAAMLAPAIAGADKAGLEAAIAHPARKVEDKARDQYRHPLETLTFFDVGSDMAVAEIYPGGGWYTDILGPYLKAKGTYHVVLNDLTDPKAAAGIAAWKTKVADKTRFGDVRFEDLRATVADDEIAPAGSLDRIVSFRSQHNMANGANSSARKPWTAKSMRAFYLALKPGGLLGIVDHRLDGKAGNVKVVSGGYLLTDYAINAAIEAGFELVGASEVNANPKDRKDYPEGVWALPPVLARKGKLTGAELDAYLAEVKGIGESDRFTLVFKKP